MGEISLPENDVEVGYAKPPPRNVRCINGAPLFAYERSNGTFALTQGCCNSWTCPRCGYHRAKTEYGRIVHGVRELGDEHHMWFLTITTRGNGLSVKDAHAGYKDWTNRLITALRYDGKKRGLTWAYAQVTEHQKRGHPHSHFLTTYYPDDLRGGTRKRFTQDETGKKKVERVYALLSDYVRKRCISAELGEVYDISYVESEEACSRYVAKYLFKESMSDHDFPKGWRRVRYSHSFPKLPKRETNAFVVMEPEHWEKLFDVARVVAPDDVLTYSMARARVGERSTVIKRPKVDEIAFKVGEN